MLFLHYFDVGDGFLRAASIVALLPGGILLLIHYYVDEVPPLSLHCLLNWLAWCLGLIPFFLLVFWNAAKRRAGTQ